MAGAIPGQVDLMLKFLFASISGADQLRYIKQLTTSTLSVPTGTIGIFRRLPSKY